MAVRQLFVEGTAAMNSFHHRGRQILLEEGWARICRQMAEQLAVEDSPRRRRTPDRLIGYFAKHTERIDHRERLARGDAIGSGVIEGAAMTLGLHLKSRGARWLDKNARAMAAMICARETERWKLFRG